MKKFFALCLLLFPGFLLHAQDWKKFSLNDIAEVAVPAPVDSILFDGKIVYTSHVPEGLITMVVSSDKDRPAVIPAYEDLTEIYAGLINGIIKQGNGKLIDSARVMSGKMEGKYLRFEINPDGESRILDCQAFVVKGKIYAFQFVQLKAIYDENAPSREQFFKSIRFRPSLTASDQYVDLREKKLSNAFNLGQMAGYISMFLGVIALIVVLVVRSTRR